MAMLTLARPEDLGQTACPYRWHKVQGETWFRVQHADGRCHFALETEVAEWCRENMRDEHWLVHDEAGVHMRFANDRDAVLFRLRWS